MRLDWGMLCNYAEAPPNGLLYISGAGVDTFARPQFPSPLMAALVVRVLVARAEADRPHQLEIQCNTVDGRPVIPQPITLTIGPVQVPPDLPTGWDISANIVANLQGMIVPSAGEYVFELLIDNQHVRSLHFRAIMPPAATQIPPAAP